MVLAFFVNWPAWAKLGFVLGSSFVVVIAIAGCVKLHKALKIRRLTKIHSTDLEAADTAEIQEKVRSSDEIPFGARAMLEEPEIEGVWNSRASTPLQSPILAPRRSSSPSRPSFNLLSRSRRNSSVSSVPTLAHFTTPESSPNHNANTPPLWPLPAFIANNGSTSTGVGGVIIARPTSQHSTTSQQVEHSLMPRRRSVTIRSASKPEQITTRSQPVSAASSRSSNDSKRRTRVSTDPMPETPTYLRHLQSGQVKTTPDKSIDALERTPTTKKALARMEAHRKFHAAESGQLQPRSRQSDERSKSSSHKRSISDSNSTGEQENSRAVSWPITAGEVLIDVQAPQKVQTKTSPPVVPFRAFVEMHPPPKTLPTTPPSAWTDKTQGLLDEKLEAVQIPKKKIVIKNDGNNGGETPKKQLYVVTNRTSPKQQPDRTSQLSTQSRKVNSGFEVLPAGSLEKEEGTLTKEFGYLTQALREASNDSKPRKLQKRDRSKSRDSRPSVDTVRHIMV